MCAQAALVMHRALMQPAGMQDGNVGLLQLALEAHTMRAVQRLTRTYMTLSLSDIAAAAQLRGPQEAELLVLRCVHIWHPSMTNIMNSCCLQPSRTTGVIVQSSEWKPA